MLSLAPRDRRTLSRPHTRTHVRSVALLSNGTVHSWGWNNSGQIARPPASLTDVIAISAGEQHTLALRSNGTVYAWGSNAFGQSNVPAAARSG